MYCYNGVYKKYRKDLREGLNTIHPRKGTLMTNRRNFFSNQELQREPLQVKVEQDFRPRNVRRSFNQWKITDGFVESVYESFLEVEAAFGGDYLHFHNTETGEILSLKVISRTRIDNPYLPENIREALVVAGIMDRSDD